MIIDESEAAYRVSARFANHRGIRGCFDETAIAGLTFDDVVDWASAAAETTAAAEPAEERVGRIIGLVASAMCVAVELERGKAAA